jgi:enoyl-[acyl-carrier-protein] reductase (NADH)
MAHSFVYWTQAMLRRDLLGPGARILALDNAINESLLGNLSVIAAAKASLETYVRHLALELGPQGYRVNALKFGTVESAALQWIFPAEVWDRVKAIHDRMFPAGRMNTMDEVAAFVSVLAMDAGAWFNSAIIDFTGGQMHAVYQLLMDVVIHGPDKREPG